MLRSKLGQTMLKLTDYFLWILEKCTEWSLPRQNIEDEKDSEKTELVRPLPWLLFLPSLMILRIIRLIVNIGASLLNYPMITPSKMIRLVQKSRRYLHDAMKKDKKERCELKDKRSSMYKGKKALIRSIRLTLSSLSCLDTPKPSPSPPPTKICISVNLDPDSVTTTSEEKLKEKSEEKSVTESMDSTSTSEHSTSESEKHEKEEKEKEQKETLKEKIDRLALENSEDDESFKPDEYSSSDVDSIDDESSDGNVSPNEIRDIVEAKNTVAFKKKVTMEQFLEVERTSTSVSEQKSIESTCEKRSSAKESRDKVEEHFATSQRIDSSECCTSDRSSQEGDLTFYSPISSDSDSDAPKEPSVSTVQRK
ncbi:hypothetical protein ALC60_08285 [Trachymyrmex zeteki]|uniref:Uncharacterized protein n=1 Tax=Mycetomoellerius zeteki TaxID=64791 RepID=A0A151WXA7_9HYME|nr:hypothetical protein ALC60_08285 [Trachymyrmex zeteki]